MFFSAMSVERYIGVFKPFKFAQVMTKRRGVLIAISTWIFGTIPALPPLVGFSTWKQGMPCTVYFVCTNFHNAINAVLVFFLKALVISAYALIAKATRHHLQNMAQLDDGSSLNINSRQKLNLGVLKTCSMVIVIFILCHIPLFIALIMTNFYTVEEILADPVYLNITIIATLAIGLNCGINPVIYALRMPQFRKAMSHLYVLCVRNASSQ